MAASLLTPSLGAIAAPATFGSASDFGSFEITESQNSESVAAYGAAVYDPWRFSGTPASQITATGFAKAHASNTQPFGLLGGMTSAGGAAATFTADTGVTYAGVMGYESVKLTHARLRAAVSLQWSLRAAGDITTTWPTS